MTYSHLPRLILNFISSLLDNLKSFLLVCQRLMKQNFTTHWRPDSLKQLVLIAFFMVVTPLGVLLYHASSALVEQSVLGRDLARQSLEIIQRGQIMQQLAEDIIRSHRQYQILAKEEIRQRRSEQLDDYQKLLAVQAFVLDNPAQLEAIYSYLKLLEETEKEVSDQELITLTKQLNQQLEQRLDARLKELNTQAQSTHHALILQASLLMSFSAVMMLYFSRRIHRPVQGLANRIRALGRGERTFGSRIDGPRELVELDRQLDWLATQLEELEGEKQRFLRHMSHELKTPLTTLREGSDLLAEEVAGELNEGQREIVDLLQQNARDLQALIEQLLDYNKLGQLEPVHPASVDLTALIQEALRPHRLLLEQKKITVTLPQDAVYWHTDRAMLLRILGNLISNAAHYGEPQGALQFLLKPEGENLLLDIENSGPTIPAEDVPHLFEPFYQGSNKRAGAIKGSGIGLSIAKDAAHALNATLNLHKNQDNSVGFRLTLTELSNNHAN